MAARPASAAAARAGRRAGGGAAARCWTRAMCSRPWLRSPFWASWCCCTRAWRPACHSPTLTLASPGSRAAPAAAPAAAPPSRAVPELARRLAGSRARLQAKGAAALRGTAAPAAASPASGLRCASGCCVRARRCACRLTAAALGVLPRRRLPLALLCAAGRARAGALPGASISAVCGALMHCYQSAGTALQWIAAKHAF